MKVRQVKLPAAARALGTLPRLDYSDAFVVDTGPAAQDRTAEEWARTILEEAWPATRTGLRLGWWVLGLRPSSTRSAILGWEVTRSTSDFALLAGRSPLGLVAELLVQRRARSLLFATLMKHENLVARAVWAATIPGHQAAVRYVLEEAAHRTGGAAISAPRAARA